MLAGMPAAPHVSDLLPSSMSSGPCTLSAHLLPAASLILDGFSQDASPVINLKGCGPPSRPVLWPLLGLAAELVWPAQAHVFTAAHVFTTPAGMPVCCHNAAVVLHSDTFNVPKAWPAHWHHLRAWTLDQWHACAQASTAWPVHCCLLRAACTLRS